MTRSTLQYRRVGAFLFWGGYQLTDDLQWQTQITGFSINTEFIRLDPDGLLTIKKWYVWDGPTFAIKTKDFIAGSCVHDALCDLVNAGLLPASEQCKVDEEMLIVNEQQRMHRLRWAYTYIAVRGYQLTKKGPYKAKTYTIELT